MRQNDLVMARSAGAGQIHCSWLCILLLSQQSTGWAQEKGQDSRICLSACWKVGPHTIFIRKIRNVFNVRIVVIQQQDDVFPDSCAILISRMNGPGTLSSLFKLCSQLCKEEREFLGIGRV